jgi:hypothetical protein
VVLNLLHTVHVADARNLSQVLLEAREVAQINGFDDEVDVNGAVGGGASFDAANIGAVFGDDGGELLEEAGSVVGLGPAASLLLPSASDHSTSMRRSAS